MDVSHVLDSLNASQRDAVGASSGNLLVLAGAGSGKTRVLVHRIAWYIATGEASPQSILAVTFTNKAAAEMRSRIESLLGQSIRGMWVGTFHGHCHRLLRAHWQDANLPENFQILDNAYGIIGIELMAAAQALDFRKHSQGKGVFFAKKEIRRHVDFLDEDRPLYKDHDVMKKIVSESNIVKAVEGEIGDIYK